MVELQAEGITQPNTRLKSLDVIDAGEQSCKESNGEMRREWPIGARSWRTVNAKSSSLGISVIGN